MRRALAQIRQLPVTNPQGTQGPMAPTRHPTHGYTRHGQAVHAHATHYAADVVRHFSPRAIRRDVQAVNGINAKLAVLLYRVLGTMWCFYAFNVIALPAVIQSVMTGDVKIIINAVSSNWLQLVFLPAIMVAQAIQAVSSDARSTLMFEHQETILDRLDEHTDGGLGTVLDELHAVHDDVEELLGRPTPPAPPPAPRKRARKPTSAPLRAVKDTDTAGE